MVPRLLTALLAVLPLALAAPAAAQEQPYRAHDGGGFRDVLPPGTDGTANGAELGAFLSSGGQQRPEHSSDQLAMYEDLVHASPGLTPKALERFFKDASFGVKEGDVARRYRPGGRPDVVVLRDRGFGVPHVYGSTRDGAMFGLGYVAAEDRLFLMDVLRNVGRARLSSFAGGAKGNRDFDQEQWSVAPYTEADLQRQVDQFDDLYGADGAQVQRDAANYIAGVNAYISEARLDPTKMPGEYAAIGRPSGPETWKETDIIATAALVGGIFGKGGGSELRDALLLQRFRALYGRTKGTRLWRDFGAFEDPEAPTTVRGRRFPYGAAPRRPRGLALPDRASVVDEPLVTARSGAAAEPPSGRRKGIFPLRALPSAMSNALVVSARESESGRPLAVFGPQTGYFSPQLLMEQDVHAPASPAGPGIDARGAAFAGTNLYVQLGRGRDYAWSATSAGQDIIDTYAVDLCEPDGSPPSRASLHYRFRGACLPMEALERTNSWEPTAADSTPAGSFTMRVYRTKLGLVRARGTVRGRPVAFTGLRRTYFHEIDSAFGFMDFNDPEKIRGPRDFQRAAHKILYTFNWFYADDRDVAYFNSGANPVRPERVDPNLPTLARQRFEWRGYDPETLTADITPFSAHPQVIGQRTLSSWNNKQAPGYRAASFGGYPSVHRDDLLGKRLRNGTAGRRKLSLVELVDLMESAGTTDLRGQEVLPWVLKVIGRPDRRTPRDRAVAGALNLLRAWAVTGAHRRDRNRDGTYEHSEAIRLMDAWWPRMLEAIFEPRLGEDGFEALHERVAFDDHNRDDHVGSAFQSGWFGYVDKDLRTLLGRRVEGRYAQVYCGRGSRARCRRALLRSLRAAMQVPASELYRDPLCPDEKLPDLQMCNEAIRHTPTGGITQPLIHWVNRPTYQQVVEVRSRRPR